MITLAWGPCFPWKYNKRGSLCWGSQDPGWSPGKGLEGSQTSFLCFSSASSPPLTNMTPQGFGVVAPKKGIEGSSCKVPWIASSPSLQVNQSGKNLGIRVWGSWEASGHGRQTSPLLTPKTTHLLHQLWSLRVLPLTCITRVFRPNARRTSATFLPDSSIRQSIHTTSGRASFTPRLRVSKSSLVTECKDWNSPTGPAKVLSLSNSVDCKISAPRDKPARV